ncbi:uncharacterized protein N0V89_005051 [Didymosphaeria variabile]|uniref:TATA element modulatory factor 1 TATA binding domain-containing protein n=1 Tax=Didymosphaeria variabile TaxID=1932322 RepID=A0A9W8XLG9_9PLEO|nr:uncharacterized protein N0V89_005051 [Didymosphaeria variabile]KAJ4353323.1 hypothetical protein N0V89_005051 [Didymosphaeria variabile]
MAQRKGGWGSFLGTAVSGLESRLDSILTDDDQASAKSRAVDAAAKQEAAEKQRLQVDQVSRSSSRSRPNSRLQDRLAKAVNKGKDGTDSRPSSELGSRPESPALKSPANDVARTSIDSRTSETAPEIPLDSKPDVSKIEEANPEPSPRPSVDATPVSPPALSVVSEQPTSMAVPTMFIPSILTPQTSSPRQSIDSAPSRPSIEISTPAEPAISASHDPETLQVELSALQTKHDETVREHREELHSHLERIDALQSKLTYLSQQLTSSAKAASSDSEATPADKKLAEKDAQIAALMEEGQRLSKTEMKHMTTIKKMRAKALETDKDITNLKQRLSKAERSFAEQTERARRAEAAEKAAQEKLKVVAKIEKDIELIRSEREEAGLTIAELRRQLNDALTRAEDAEKRVKTGSLEAEKRITASLQEDIENIRIEKKLAEDRAKKDLQEARDEATRQQERAKVSEMELRGEIANLESKLELLRSRSEEVSSSASGDSQAKLLRQIETLQTQYALASENWQGIEGTLTSRVAALEKDRDDTAKREADIRRKAREVNSKARRLEDELDSINDRARTLEQDLTEQRSSAQKLQARLTQAETAAQDARADLEREKKVLEADFAQKLEEEKNKWRVEMQTQASLSENHLRTDSPGASLRRHSPDPLGIYGANRRGVLPRSISQGMDTPMDRMLEEARRPSSSRQKSTSTYQRTPEIGSPQRQDSFPSISSNLMSNGHSVSNTPSITFDDAGFEGGSSPHRTINDMISVSTVGAGPSVQLVERLSTAVRRLESEKATNKEEMARLISQRDEAREEVVTLMREIDEKREQGDKVGRLEKEMQEMNQRYEKCLEMLGEKSERVEELEEDLKDVKKMYRDLVSSKY